ncbi:hypothetical protein [Stenotrophomonas maltophilia]|uniref:hypothetical protein n=1 Tax=Stenotrophomonas maltophilia TaxID=40324 RepID=UPI00117E29C2|nr:hypothetical protein [Stenotrophomonas maltophilia]
MRFKLIPKDEKLDRIAPNPRVSQALLDDLQQWSEASQCRKAKLQRQIIQHYLQNYSDDKLERAIEKAPERPLTPNRYLQMTRVSKSDLDALRERAEALNLPKKTLVRLMMEAAVKRWKQSTSDERP